METALRLVALACLAWLTWSSFHERRREGSTMLPGDRLSSSINEWVMGPPADTMKVRFAGSPDQQQRALLRALERSGTAIGWSAKSLTPLMLDAEPILDPVGGVVVRAAGADRAVVSDTLGLLDSIVAGPMGVTLRLSRPAGTVRIRSGSTSASVSPTWPAGVKRVVVLGSAGWESRFIIRALEERGWPVDSRLAIAPDRFTERGNPFPLDTTRHAVVIAVDSIAGTNARAIETYVRSGGGLILTSAAHSAFRGLAPAGMGSSSPPAIFVSQEDFSRDKLPFRPLVNLRPGASPVEERNGRTTLAIWRVGAGRVLESGYEDTWRWRMQGGEAAPAAHRAWWSNLVAAVTQRGRAAGLETADPAPLASLRLMLGEPGEVGEAPSRSVPTWPLVLAVGILAMAGEWLSRRLRGAA